MTTTITVNADMLRAALLCTSAEETRYYLNGVFVDPAGKLVSTDGHRMFVGAIDLASDNTDDNPAPGSFTGWIICRDVLKRALAGHKLPTITIAPDRVGDIACKPIDGTFPDWRRVVPSEITGTVAQFNPAYVADMGKIGLLLQGKPRRGYSSGTALSAHIHHNGEGPAGVTFPGVEDAYAVLMPIRGAYHDDAAQWATITA
jgi:DNA polymerase-3 subunit beta